MRVKHKVNVIVSVDKDGKDRLFGLDDGLSEVILDGNTEASSGTLALLASTPFTVPFGGVATVRGLFLKADKDFTVSFSGGAAVTVKRGPSGPNAAVATSARVFLEAQVTSLSVTAAQDMNLVYCVWGDPSP